MRLAEKNDIPAIVEYLKRDIANCIYLYIDICKYGLDHPELQVWIDEDEDGLNLIAMRYYNSLQLYTLAETWDVRAVRKMILKAGYPVVNGKIAMLRPLLAECPGYELHNGEVYQCVNTLHKKVSVEILHADETDYQEIAELICIDKNFAHYEPSSLAEQMRERAERGMGRSLIVRKDNEIIAHIATFAEYENIAVTSGLIAHPDHKEYPYGTVLECALVDELLEEGKTVYSFVTSSARKAWMRALKNPLVADYGKMILRT